MKKRMGEKGNLEQKNKVRIIAFEQGSRYVLHISSDSIFDGHEGDFLIFNCCMAQC